MIKKLKSIAYDERITRATHGSVLLVALFAAIISYTHIRDLALRNGYDQFTSYLLPLSVDGLIVGASFMLVAASRVRLRAPLARCALWLGIGATVAANVAYGLPQTLGGPAMRASVAAWPAVAFITIVEAWMQLQRKRKKEAKKTGQKVDPKPGPAKTKKPVKPTLTISDSHASVEDARDAAGISGEPDKPWTAYRVARDLKCNHKKSVELAEIINNDGVDLETAQNIRNERMGKPHASKALSNG